MVHINSQSDAQLLKNVTDHNKEAFMQLYDRYSSLLYSLIKKIVTEKETAERILQEVFLIVWKRADKVAVENVFTFLVLLAKSKAHDFIRRQQGETVIPVYDDEFECFDILPNLSTDIKTVELDEALKIKNEMGKIISSLTDAQRYVLSLFYFDCLKDTDVAEKLKIPVATVKSKLLVAVGILLEKTRKLV